MRRRHSGLVVALVGGAVLAMGGCATGQRDPGVADARSVDDQTVQAVAVIHGLSCPLCASNVERQLGSLAGVERIEIDLSSGRVVLFCKDTPPTAKAVAEAADSAGFELISYTLPAEAQ